MTRGQGEKKCLRLENDSIHIDALLTRSPVTGALRPVTEDLLAEVYFAPRREEFCLVDHLGLGESWSDSFATAPEETARAVEDRLATVAHAALKLDPADIAVEGLPKYRARCPLAALRRAPSLEG